MAGRLQGARDIALNARGRDQARALGPALAKLLAAMPDMPAPASLPMLASPLSRTRQTTDIMRAAMGLPPQDYATDDRLVEIAFGAWEGKTWREIAKEAPILAKQRRASPWDFEAPQGGESYHHVSLRVDGVLAEHAEPFVMIAHGGIGRTLMEKLAGLAPENILTVEIAQGRIYVFADGSVCEI